MYITCVLAYSIFISYTFMYKYLERAMYCYGYNKNIAILMNWIWTLCSIQNLQMTLLVFQNKKQTTKSNKASTEILRLIQGVHQILCFFLKMLWFSELCQFCCSVGCLPALCVYTHRHQREKKGRVRNNLKFSEKTQYLMNTLYMDRNYE